LIYINQNKFVEEINLKNEDENCRFALDLKCEKCIDDY